MTVFESNGCGYQVGCLEERAGSALSKREKTDGEFLPWLANLVKGSALTWRWLEPEVLMVPTVGLDHSLLVAIVFQGRTVLYRGGLQVDKLSQVEPAAVFEEAAC